MENTTEINYDAFEDIVIADDHLNGYDYDRCKNALWSIHNVIGKIKSNSTPELVHATLYNLYLVGKLAAFKDSSMDALIFAEYEKVKICGRLQKVRFSSTFKINIEKSGFVFSDFIFADGDEPVKNPSLNKVRQFTFSYNGDDFTDVIFGLKLFAEICDKYPTWKHAGGSNAGIFFPNGDISIAFKGADMKKKEQEYIAGRKIKMCDMLLEDRFNIISGDAKAFILAFDEAMNGLGYDYGDRIGGNVDSPDRWDGKFQVVYTKTGAGTRAAVFARLYIWEDRMTLRLYFTDIDKHRAYIENAPAHIKNAFAFEGGDCRTASGEEACGGGCQMMKVYTIDGQWYSKCCHSMAHFADPSVQKLPDYMALLAEFFPKKNKQ